MAKKISAGLLPFRYDQNGCLEVFLVHPGGPFWARKDEGAWSVAKGEVDDGEDDFLSVALREFREETGFAADGEFIQLEPVRQPSGKVVHTWAVSKDFDPTDFESNEFEMEWPRGSGEQRSFPEVDRVEWFNIPTAKRKILKGQIPIIEQIVDQLGYNASDDKLFDDSGQATFL